MGRDYPLSIEKLCPVLSFYVVSDWREGCERCKQILRYGGMGHTMSIHSQNDQVILEFGLKKPAFRICVNTPTTLGSIGLTTGLDPAMTLGCGGYGGNITSDNISPRHLLNIKRLAYEITPAVSLSRPRDAGEATSRDCAGSSRSRRASAPGRSPGGSTSFWALAGFAATRTGGRPRPATPASPREAAAGIDAAADGNASHARRSRRRSNSSARRTCGWRFRRAESWSISERAIVTPSARDLAEEHRVLTLAPGVVIGAKDPAWQPSVQI